MTWLVFFLIALASIHDLRRREIPDGISIAVASIAVLGEICGLAQLTWLDMTTGSALALAIGLPLFACGGLGGGDTKLIAALGACLGPLALLHTLYWIAICGGVLAIVAACRGKRDFAYGPAIALGLLLHLLQLEVFGHA